MKIIKAKKYKKLIIQTFVEVKYFYKQIYIIMILEQDFCNIMAIIILHVLLHQDFKLITTKLLKVSNKIIN